MPSSLTTVRRYRSKFGWAFVISAFVVMACISYPILWTKFNGFRDYFCESMGYGGPQPGHRHAPDQYFTLVISVLSLAVAGASLAGFLLTSASAWHKKRTEQMHSEVDLERRGRDRTSRPMDIPKKAVD